MSAKNLEIAKKYYPKFWSDAKVRALVEAGKLTKEEYKELTGHDYDPVDEEVPTEE